MRLVARRSVTAVTFSASAGELALDRWLQITAGGPGLLVLAGMLVSQARVLDRTVAELLGKGDLLTLSDPESDERFLACERSWLALQPARIAILDARFTDQARRWPQINHALLRRVQNRLIDLATQRGIAAQPRLDVRLLLLLWHLAGRWGKVEPGGVRVPVALTHLLLGRLVGAERPSVTHAVKRLSAAGLIKCSERGWHLRGTLGRHLSALAVGEETEHLATSLIAPGDAGVAGDAREVGVAGGSRDAGAASPAAVSPTR